MRRDDAVPETWCGVTESGWMTTAVFEEYFTSLTVP